MGRPFGSKNKPRVDAIAPQGDDMAEAATAPTLSLTLDQLKELLATTNTQGFTPEDIAKAFQATQRHENPAAPMVTIYNPKGDRDHPKPVFLARKVTQNGVELDRDTLTVEEITAINALKPGEYRVEKANGTMQPFTVGEVKGLDGITVERKELFFPSKDDNRYDHKSLLEYCLDVMGQCKQHKDVDQIRALKAELDALRPPR